MGKTLLLVIAAAVLGSTYLRLNHSEADIAAADSHRYVQAEQLAEDVAMGGRTMVLGKMMAGGGAGFVSSADMAAHVPIGTAIAYNGQSTLGHFTVETYTVSPDGMTAELSVLGKHYKDYERKADGSDPWVHATHRVRTTYTLQGIPDDFGTPDPDVFIDVVESGTSCSVNDVAYTGGLDLGGDLHFGDEPRLVRITGGLNIPNNRRLDGTGLLVIEGDLTVQGDLLWDGVVLVYNENNDMRIDLDRADVLEISGALLLGDQIDVQDILDTVQGESASPTGLGGLLTSAGGTFDFDADDVFTLEYDKLDVFAAAKCMGLTSYVLAQQGVQVETSEDAENDGHVCRNNNGHGNNADGVDSSNPGEGNGGPNGEPDASCTVDGPCIDDENRP